MDHVYSLLQQEGEKMNVTFEIDVKNDIHHTLGLVQNNCTLSIHHQTLYHSQQSVVFLAYFHHE
jgi:hypothetical protein